MVAQLLGGIAIVVLTLCSLWSRLVCYCYPTGQVPCEAELEDCNSRVDEGPPLQPFVELEMRIAEAIQKYGSVFPRLNWSAPVVRCHGAGDSAPVFQQRHWLCALLSHYRAFRI